MIIENSWRFALYKCNIMFETQIQKFLKENVVVKTFYLRTGGQKWKNCQKNICV